MNSLYRIEYKIKEIDRLNHEIHQYLRMPHLILTMAITILPFIIGQIYHEQPADIIYLITPLIFGILVIYNLNISSEVAGLSTIRDRLSENVNNIIKQPIYMSHVLGSIRRHSKGTIAAYSLAAVIMLLTMIIGIVHVQYRITIKALPWWWLLMQVGMTIISISAIMVGLVEFLQTPSKMHKKLDEIFSKTNNLGNLIR